MRFIESFYKCPYLDTNMVSKSTSDLNLNMNKNIFNSEDSANDC